MHPTQERPKNRLIKLFISKCFPGNFSADVQERVSRILKYSYTTILKSSVGPFRQALIFGYPIAAGEDNTTGKAVCAGAAVYMQLRSGIVYGMFISGDVDHGLLQIETIAEWLATQHCDEMQFDGYERRLNALINVENIGDMACTLRLFRHAPIVPDDGFVSAIINKICVATLSSIQEKCNPARIRALHQTIHTRYSNYLTKNGAIVEYSKNIDRSVMAMIDKLCVDFGPECRQLKVYNYFAAGTDVLQRNRLQAVNELPWLMPFLTGLNSHGWHFSSLAKSGNDNESGKILPGVALISAGIDAGRPLFRSVSSALSIPCETVRWTQYKCLPAVAIFNANEVDLMITVLSWLPAEKRPKIKIEWECFCQILSKLIKIVFSFYVHPKSDFCPIKATKFGVEIIRNQYCARLLERWLKEVVRSGLIGGARMLGENSGQRTGISDVPDFLRCLLSSLKRFCSAQVFLYPAPLDSFQTFMLEWLQTKSLAELRNISKKWHESIRDDVDESVPLAPASVISDQADAIDTWPLVLDEPFFYGQIQIVELKNPISLLVEGKLLEHCVGGYSENCRAGSSLVFSVRTCTGSRLSTVELHLSSFPLGVELRSHKAKRNACPQMECEAAVTALIHVLNSANFVDRLEKRRTFQQNQLFRQAGPSRPKPSVLRRYELLTQTLAWRCAFRSEPSQEFPTLVWH